MHSNEIKVVILQAGIKLIAWLALLALSIVGLVLGYGSQNFIVSGMSWAALLVGAFLVLFGIYAIRRKDQTPSNSIYTELEKRLLIQSMACVASADNRLRDIEVMTISNIHEQLLKEIVDPEEIHTLLEGLNCKAVLENLRKNANAISDHMKRIMIQSCHLIMISDSEIMGTEENRIHEIGAAIGFTAKDVDELIILVST